MATPSSPWSGFNYRPAPLAPLPPTLDPAYYDASPEKRRAEAERLAIRSRLKRKYLLQLNDPRRPFIVEDTAMTQWTYARANIYPHFRVTPKTSFLGALFGIGPIAFWWYVFKTEKDYTEKLIREGKYERPFHLAY
ncbi:NADH dehydrogenase [ubiquinone] 1 beta subcomplex subunit 4 [Heteronotia binoei]|uniref:NADH dehydrogenase [ubiquinone] 1 beta subcomplex subunit 4 n=1 Tax=Heteronotia binoei TaxID=13085 RepID=UPI00293139CD|nr:NADH dehydrogenase [ubiquinone] 1 beta subcomplex subunit 4 [Heteronotia binoei]